jgi:hypothetical protein
MPLRPAAMQRTTATGADAARHGPSPGHPHAPLGPPKMMSAAGHRTQGGPPVVPGTTATEGTAVSEPSSQTSSTSASSSEGSHS